MQTLIPQRSGVDFENTPVESGKPDKSRVKVSDI